MITVRSLAIDSFTGRLLVQELAEDLATRYAVAPDTASASFFEHYLGEISPSHTSAPAGAFRVAYVGEVPAACGALRPFAAEGTAEIKRMFVRPPFRGRGLSRRVLVDLEGEARALGYHEVVLETGIRQPEAIALYESAGYTRIPNYGKWEGNDLSRCYRKVLG